MDDFDCLLMAATEDELTDERRRELFARLQADPVQCGRYVDLMMLHSEMEWGRANGAANQRRFQRAGRRLADCLERKAVFTKITE